MQLYYRGELNFCNYKCEYCPFSKKRASKRILERDKASLFRFVEKLEQDKSVIKKSILITPYGEGLIHDHYQIALARLSRIDTVDYVGIQTNMSFNIPMFIDNFKKNEGNLKKLILWCTWHPSMICVEEFANNANLIYREGIKISVGAVGVPENIVIIRELRAQLPEEVYLWINKMDGMGRKYTEEEIKAFSEIDFSFSNELRHYRSNPEKCKESFFISSNGNISGCAIGKAVMGNFYENTVDDLISIPRLCKSSNCDCYLAYNNLSKYNNFRVSQWDLYGEYPAFRNKFRAKALFFDIDGTLLTDNCRKINLETVEGLKQLSENYSLYLNTSRPYIDAKKVLGNNISLFRGGIFAGGGEILLWSEAGKLTFSHFIGINITGKFKGFLDKIKSKENFGNCFIKKYVNKEKTYKITFIFRKYIDLEIFTKALSEIIPDNVTYYVENKCVSVVSEESTKLKGTKILCNELGITLQNIAFWGNDKLDMELINECGRGSYVTSENDIKKSGTDFNFK